MNFFESVELMLIKQTLEWAAKKRGEETKSILEDLGIQADVSFEVNVKAVDLDTLHSKMSDGEKAQEYFMNVIKEQDKK